MGAVAAVKYERGDVVVYQGSVASEQGQLYYVGSRNPHGGLNLSAVEYPTVGRLFGVRPRSVRATGERLVLCVCGHALKVLRPGVPCACASCECVVHDVADQPQQTLACLTVDEVKLYQVTAWRWLCVSCGLSDGDFVHPAAALATGARDHQTCRAGA